MKKETLEEAAKSNYDNKTSRIPVPTSHWINSEFLQIQNFIEGAKWQQEQDKNKYSEEEVDVSIHELINKFTDWSGSYVYNDKLIEIYKQLKKK